MLEHNMDRSLSRDRAGQDGELSPLEQEVLDEYVKLIGNLDTLADNISALADSPSAEILDSLRVLERRTSTVFTLLKASVYSIVLQQEVYGNQASGG